MPRPPRTIGAMDETERNGYIRRRCLLVLGRTINHKSDLKAELWEPGRAGTWVLEVTGPNDRAVIHCDKVAGVWELNWSSGERIAEASATLTAAREVIRQMGGKVKPAPAQESEWAHGA